ncbi:class I SAM-dependent methyltransferase [Cognatishimia maritima]
MMNAEKFWDGVAPKYAKSPIKNQAGFEQTLNRTRGYLKPDDRVLEIGAGTGSTALLLADSVAEIVATDISDKMLEVGRARAWEQCINNVTFQQRDAGDLPDGPFDVVLAHNILHLVEDLPAVLNAVYATLKPGGLFISKTFVKPTRGLQLEYRVMRLALPLMQRFGKAPFVSMFQAPDFDAEIKRAGFEILEAGHFPDTETRRYIVARKR